jgi:hypothetical protein
MSLKRPASRTPVKWTVGLKRFGNGILHRIALCRNISGVTSKRSQNSYAWSSPLKHRTRPLT